MLTQRRGIIRAYTIACLVHFVGWVAYVYRFIPKDIQSYYYYNLDRIFMLSFIYITYFVIADINVKKLLRCMLIMYLLYFVMCNVSFFITLDSTVKLMIATLTAMSIITALITMYDTRRSKNLEG